MSLLNPVTAQTNLADTVLKKGQPAPFYGVLSSEGAYRYYRQEEKLAQSLRSEIFIKDEVISSYEKQANNKVTFLIGVVVGGLITALASK